MFFFISDCLLVLTTTIFYPLGCLLVLDISKCLLVNVQSITSFPPTLWKSSIWPRTIFPLITKCLLVDARSYNSLLPFVWKSSSWRETPSCYSFYLTDLSFLLLFPLMLYTAKQRRPSYRTRHDRGGLARLFYMSQLDQIKRNKGSIEKFSYIQDLG